MVSLVFLALALVLLPWTVGGTSVACGLLLLSCLPRLKRIHTWKSHPLFRVTFLLWIVQGLGYFLSEDRELGWKYATTIWPILFIFLAQAVARRQGKSIGFGILFLSSAVLASLYATGQTLGWWSGGVSVPRASGTLIPFVFSSLMMVALFAVLDLLVHQWKTHKFLLFVVPGLCFAIVNEGSRLVIPGFFGALFVFLFFLRKTGKKKLVLAVLSLFLVVNALFLPQLELGRRVDHAVSGAAFKDTGSLGIRVTMWKAASVLFLESPLLGCGVGDFRLDSQRLYETHTWFEKRTPPPTRHHHAHNLFFHRLATQGLLGMAVFLWWLVVLWKTLMKGIPRSGIWGRTAVLSMAILLFMGVGDIMFKSHYLLGPCLFAGIALGLAQREKERNLVG